MKITTYFILILSSFFTSCSIDDYSYATEKGTNFNEDISDEITFT